MPSNIIFIDGTFDLVKLTKFYQGYFMACEQRFGDEVYSKAVFGVAFMKKKDAKTYRYVAHVLGAHIKEFLENNPQDDQLQHITLKTDW